MPGLIGYWKQLPTKDEYIKKTQYEQNILLQLWSREIQRCWFDTGMG